MLQVPGVARLLQQPVEGLRVVERRVPLTSRHEAVEHQLARVARREPVAAASRELQGLAVHSQRRRRALVHRELLAQVARPGANEVALTHVSGVVDGSAQVFETAGIAELAARLAACPQGVGR